MSIYKKIQSVRQEISGNYESIDKYCYKYGLCDIMNFEDGKWNLKIVNTDNADEVLIFYDNQDINDRQEAKKILYMSAFKISAAKGSTEHYKNGITQEELNCFRIKDKGYIRRYLDIKKHNKRLGIKAISKNMGITEYNGKAIFALLKKLGIIETEGRKSKVIMSESDYTKMLGL